MRYDILNYGDQVLNITDNYLIIRRDNGTVDLYAFSGNGSEVMISTNPVATIGYSKEETDDPIGSFVTASGVSIINF